MEAEWRVEFYNETAADPRAARPWAVLATPRRRLRQRAAARHRCQSGSPYQIVARRGLALGEREATAGSGERYVPAGLLQKANEAPLAGVLTHDLAHDDPGHVAKARGAGLNIGLVIVDRITPGDKTGRPPAHSGRSVS